MQLVYCNDYKPFQQWHTFLLFAKSLYIPVTLKGNQIQTVINAKVDIYFEVNLQKRSSMQKLHIFVVDLKKER